MRRHPDLALTPVRETLLRAQGGTWLSSCPVTEGDAFKCMKRHLDFAVAPARDKCCLVYKQAPTFRTDPCETDAFACVTRHQPCVLPPETCMLPRPSLRGRAHHIGPDERALFLHQIKVKLRSAVRVHR